MSSRSRQAVRRLDVQDPAGQSIETVRAIRDEIERRVGELPLQD
jgi:hypothetical protein